MNEKNNSDQKDDFNYEKDVSKTHLAAYGWDLSSHEKCDPFSCHVFYLHDFRASTLNVLAISKEDFEEVKTRKVPIGVLVYEIGKIMAEQGNRPLDENIGSKLRTLLASYLKETQSYRLWKQRYPKERIHAVINIYADARKEAILRPALIQRDETFVCVDSITAISQAILKADLAAHPEWFK